MRVPPMPSLKVRIEFVIGTFDHRDHGIQGIPSLFRDDSDLTFNVFGIYSFFVVAKHRQWMDELELDFFFRK